MRGYLAQPAKAAGKLPAILVIHENRGLNPHIEDVTRRLALDNFVAFAPDALFPLGGYPGDEDKARTAVPAARPDEDARGLRAGGGLAQGPSGDQRPRGRRRLLLRRRHRQHAGDAGAGSGGGRRRSTAAVPNLEDVPKIKAPLVIQSAEIDERINAGWPAYEAALKAANVRYERHLYPGTQHGFNNDTTPRYDAAAAKLAWERTLAFFNKHVRGA